jgi:hypothetical protein
MTTTTTTTTTTTAVTSTTAIFVISTIVARCIGDRWHCPCKARAWYPTLEAAQEVVAAKESALDECLNTHVVIEEAPQGLWSLCTNAWWYEWQGGGWRQCEKPIWAQGTINFGVG